MKAYVVSDIAVTDPELFEQYKLLSAPTVERHGGRFLVRGGGLTVVEGDWSPRRLTIIEFPSRDAAVAWIESDEYRPARAVRHRSAETNLVIVQGAA